VNIGDAQDPLFKFWNQNDNAWEELGGDAATTNVTQLGIGIGTITDPAIIFTATDDGTGTGLYSIGDQVAFTVNGVVAGQFAPNSLQMKTGSANTPAFTFRATIAEGMYDKLKVHMIQCKLGKSRAKQSEIDFMKFMREKGVDAYYMTYRANPRRKYHRMELEEVEQKAIDNGCDDREAALLIHRHLPHESPDRCSLHPRYGATKRPRIKKGMDGCTCHELYAKSPAGKGRKVRGVNVLRLARRR